jgi:hypothetical protein
VCCDEKWLTCSEPYLMHQGTELRRERPAIVAGCARWFIRITVAPHIGSEDRVARRRKNRHYFILDVAGSQESMPQQHRRAAWIPSHPIVNSNPVYQRGLARKAGDVCRQEIVIHRRTSREH